MQSPLLINRSDFDGRVDISANLSDKKLNQHILHAQDFDLRDLMGDNFYFDMLAKFRTEPYKSLIEGRFYPKDGVQRNFEGLKAVIAYFTAAKLIFELDLTITPNGIYSKRNEYSDAIDDKTKLFRANQYKNMAISVFNMAKDYINENANLFQYWGLSCGGENQAPKTRARFRSVGFNTSFGKKTPNATPAVFPTNLCNEFTLEYGIEFGNCGHAQPNYGTDEFTMEFGVEFGSGSGSGVVIPPGVVSEFTSEFTNEFGSLPLTPNIDEFNIEFTPEFGTVL